MFDCVELGFLEECESWQVESRLFPSKVGGLPAWLNLENLPTYEMLQCKKCRKTMIFLCQIYAPYEEDNKLSVDNYLHNFHRTLFVFICKNIKCCERNNSDNIKVLRSSLPRVNKFYSYEPPDEKPKPDFSVSKWVKLCNICGCSSEKQCSRCKKVHYCSREHQVVDWKEGHKTECGTNHQINRASKLLFPEWEIIIESEDHQENVVNEQDELRKFEQLKAVGKTGVMSEISELDFDVHATKEKDKVFAKFQKRINDNPDQVIRYKRGGEPLWIAKEPTPENIPDCEYCGGPRSFEFQIMPQMLSFIKDTELDWGVIVIYSCLASCANDNTYKEELVYKQDVALNI